MKMFKRILFIGLGGAGQRHLRLFKEFLSDEDVEFIAFRSTSKTPLLNPDFSINQEDSIESFYRIKVFTELENALNSGPDLAVISTPTSTHMKYASICASKGISIFVEKPLSHNLDGFELFKEKILNNKLYFYVSFQRRFHPYLMQIYKIIKNNKLGKIINAKFNVCSFVPDWHKYENFRDLYACRSELGGGVLLTEIHEIDLCYWYFGLPESVLCTGGNYSIEKLNVEDTAHLILKYKNFAAQISLCFMQKHNQRELSIAGTKGFVQWKDSGNEFIFDDYEKEEKAIYSNSEYNNDDMFRDQTANFMKYHKQKDSIANVESAKASIAIVEAAKASMRSNMAVNIDSS